MTGTSTTAPAGTASAGATRIQLHRLPCHADVLLTLANGGQS